MWIRKKIMLQKYYSLIKIFFKYWWLNLFDFPEECSDHNLLLKKVNIDKISLKNINYKWTLQNYYSNIKTLNKYWTNIFRAN